MERYYNTWYTLSLLHAHVIARLLVTSGIHTYNSYRPIIQRGKYSKVATYVMDVNITCSDALDALSLYRYCCRRMLLTHVDLIEKL